MAKLAFMAIEGSVLMIPRQFGPTRGMSYWALFSCSFASSSAPSGPISLKPAEMMRSPLTPFRPASSMTPGMAVGGMMSTARSTSSSMAESEG